MKRLFVNWNFWKHFILCCIITLGIGLMDVFFGYKEAASIGIIGGTDGPTAILISNSVYSYFVNMTVFVSGLILYLPVKRLFNTWYK